MFSFSENTKRVIVLEDLIWFVDCSSIVYNRTLLTASMEILDTEQLSTPPILLHGSMTKSKQLYSVEPQEEEEEEVSSYNEQ